MEIEVYEPRRRKQGTAIASAESPEEQEKAESEALRDFLRLAQTRFKRASEAEDRYRRDALDDLEFRSGKQWPAEVLGSRLADGRPCLTMNRLPQFIRQVTNEQRQQNTGIQINPVGSGADVDTAEVLQGIIRHIELGSDAEIAYDNGFESMVTIGFGYWRILLDFAPGTEELEIYIKRVRNPFTIYFDPSAIEPDYSDARWAFAIEDLSLEEYRATYPDSEIAKMEDFQSIGDMAPSWATKDTIRIADYFHIEEDEKVTYTLEDGNEVDAEAYQNMPEGRPQVTGTRKELDRKVVWSKINAVEVLEEKDWPGYWIPIVPVLGDDLDVNGTRYLAGMVRHLKDAQRQYNFWTSAATETIALAPKAPFIVAEGQLEGHEGQWAAANQRNFAYLEYKPTDVRGVPVGPPQRQAIEAPIESMSRMLAMADNDMKSISGLYDASLGKQGPEQSGKAILARQQQGSIATLNYGDNLSRSKRFTGKQLIDLIPKIYEGARIQRIVKPDGAVSHVGIFNSGTIDQADAQEQLRDAMEKQSISRIFDIGVGRYDVSPSVGPSYQSKRQESVASMIELTKAYPQIMGIAGDLVVRNMDWPGSQELAARIKKSLPPQLLDDGSLDPKQQIAKLQAQLMQQGQLVEGLTQQNQQMTQMIQTKQVEQQGKMSIEQMKIDAQVAIAEINAKSQDTRERMKWEHDIFLQLHGSAHEEAQASSQRQHEAKQADLDRQNEAKVAKQSATLQKAKKTKSK